MLTRLVSIPAVLKKLQLPNIAAIVVNKLSNSNKSTKDEAMSFFSNLVKSIGKKSYLNLLLCYLDSDHPASSVLNSTTQTKYTILHLIDKNFTPSQSKQDYEINKLLSILSKLSHSDDKLHNKISDIIYTLAKRIDKQTILI
jgi:hypothetical protein